MEYYTAVKRIKLILYPKAGQNLAYVEWNKPEPKVYILSDLFYRKFKDGQNHFIWIEVRIVVIFCVGNNNWEMLGFTYVYSFCNNSLGSITVICVLSCVCVTFQYKFRGSYVINQILISISVRNISNLKRALFLSLVKRNKHIDIFKITFIGSILRNVKHLCFFMK